MKTLLKKAIKNVVKKTFKIFAPKPIKNIYNDYKEFSRTYYASCGLTKYLSKRMFASFKNGRYYVDDPHSVISGNILMGKNCRIAQRGGCYIQGLGKLFLGDYVNVAQNCIIVSANHDIYDHSREIPKETIIGDYCWIASNACIMAGVVLGPRTIVAAGAVVTKSYPDGFCILGGNPAKVVKSLDKEMFIAPKYEIEHYGYIRADKFPDYKAKYLSHLKFNYDLSKVTSNADLIKDSILLSDTSELKS